MANRADLIARKQEIRRQIEQTQRVLERALHPQTGEPNRRQIRSLETKLERLMAQEFNLRLAIDRSR